MADYNDRKNKVIIGIGGAGKNVLAQMGPIPGTTRIHVNSDEASFSNAEAEEHIYIERPQLSRGQTNESVQRLLQICTETKHLVIITGLRGFTGSRVLNLLVDTLLGRLSATRIIIFTPFKFEQPCLFQPALDGFSKLQSTVHLSTCIIDLQRERELAPMGSSLESFLSHANQLAIELATDAPGAGKRSVLADMVNVIDAAPPRKKVATIRQVSRIENVTMTPDLMHTDGDGTVSRSREIHGTVACLGHVTDGSVCFRIHGARWKNDREKALEDARIFSEYAKLHEHMRLGEGVILSYEVFILTDDCIEIMDPEIQGTGITFEVLTHML